MDISIYRIDSLIDINGIKYCNFKDDIKKGINWGIYEKVYKGTVPFMSVDDLADYDGFDQDFLGILVSDIVIIEQTQRNIQVLTSDNDFDLPGVYYINYDGYELLSFQIINYLKDN